jgi:hypothetical protein
MKNFSPLFLRRCSKAMRAFKCICFGGLARWRIKVASDLFYRRFPEHPSVRSYYMKLDAYRELQIAPSQASKNGVFHSNLLVPFRGIAIHHPSDLFSAFANLCSMESVPLNFHRYLIAPSSWCIKPNFSFEHFFQNT